MNSTEKKQIKRLSSRTIFEYIFIFLMLIIVGIFIVRYAFFSEKPFASELIWSANAEEVYNMDPDNFIIYEIPSIAVSQGMDASLSGNEYSDLANYTISNMVYFAPTNEFQLTVKYPVRNLSDKNITRPYDFVLEDSLGNRYNAESIEEKTITGYVYCRVTFDNVDIFSTNSIGMIFVSNGTEKGSRLIYNTLDRFDETRNINVYNISYSDIKRKYSFRIRLDKDEYVNPEITVKADGTVIKPTVMENNIYGKKSQYFLEFEEMFLENYEKIELYVNGSCVVVYDSATDRRVLDDFSTDGFEVASYYEIPDNTLITPVVGTNKYSPNN